MNELRKLIHWSRANSVAHFRSFFEKFLIRILEETIVILTHIFRCSAQFLKANPTLAYLIRPWPLPSTYTSQSQQSLVTYHPKVGLYSNVFQRIIVSGSARNCGANNFEIWGKNSKQTSKRRGNFCPGNWQKLAIANNLVITELLSPLSIVFLFCTCFRGWDFPRNVLLLLPLALQPTVGFGLSNNVLPFLPICHQLSPSSHSEHLKISFHFLFPSFPGSSPFSRPFQFLSEDLFGHPILLHSL